MPKFGIDQLKKTFEDPEFGSELNELSSYAANIKQENSFHYLLAKYLNRSRGLNVTLEKKGRNLQPDWCYKPKVNRRYKPKTDLFLNGAKIEVKFHFECDLPSLRKELEDYNYSINRLCEELKTRIKNQKSHTYTVAFPILKDIFCKEPDIFIWIIQSSNLEDEIRSGKNIKIVCEEDHLGKGPREYTYSEAKDNNWKCDEKRKKASGEKTCGKMSIIKSDRICWATERGKYQLNFGFNNSEFLKEAEKFLEMIKKGRSFKQYRHFTLPTKRPKIPKNSLYFPNFYHIYLCDFRE